MFTFVSYALAFLAGLLLSDLIHFAEAQHQVRQMARLVARMGGPLETTINRWAADPRYWCDRPGCSRCWGGWGRS